MFLFLLLSCSHYSSSPSVVANTDGLGSAAPNLVDGRVDVGMGSKVGQAWGHGGKVR